MQNVIAFVVQRKKMRKGMKEKKERKKILTGGE
jgi:hypothetical protein